MNFLFFHIIFLFRFSVVVSLLSVCTDVYQCINHRFQMHWFIIDYTRSYVMKILNFTRKLCHISNTKKTQAIIWNQWYIWINYIVLGVGGCVHVEINNIDLCLLSAYIYTFVFLKSISWPSKSNSWTLPPYFHNGFSLLEIPLRKLVYSL